MKRALSLPPLRRREAGATSGVQLYGAGSPNTNAILSVWTNSYLYYRDDVRCVVLIRHRLPTACATFPLLACCPTVAMAAGILAKNYELTTFSFFPCCYALCSIAYDPSGVTSARTAYDQGGVVRVALSYFFFFFIIRHGRVRHLCPALALRIFPGAAAVITPG
jgi:hypothetical protein